MLINKKLQGVLKYIKEIEKFSKEKNLPFMALCFDCLKSHVVYGCVLNQYTLGNFYKRKNFERKIMLTYRRWEKIISKYNSHSKKRFLEDKTLFNEFYCDLVGRDWISSSSMQLQDFIEFVKKHKFLVIKPIEGSEGEGIICRSFNISDNLKDAFNEYSNKKVIVEEKIIQHDRMIFGNKSVNTIRVYTAYNPKKRCANIIKCVVRVGVGDSFVDNSHSGGCAYEVDLENGYVISNAYAANGYDGFIQPKTNICMLGKEIPFWDEVKQMCILAANRIPEIQFIGWDVAITNTGPKLVEGNHRPDLDMVEFVGSYGYYYKIMNELNGKL